MNDKNVIVDLALQRCKLVNENIDKNPLDTSQNVVNFLKNLTYEYIQEMGIRDRLAIILWARKFINKHNLVKVVQEKENQMFLEVKDFNKIFQKHFNEGLPPFWDDNGKLFFQEQYHRLLVQDHMDHSKFEELTKALTGKVIIETLTDDFENLNGS